MPRSPITTHVLDVARGCPAAGVKVTLEFEKNGSWQELAKGETDADGRAGNLLPEGSKIDAGVYRITFDTQSYSSGAGFYPFVPVIFTVRDPGQHYHVPLLLSPFGYSTYRGS